MIIRIGIGHQDWQPPLTADPLTPQTMSLRPESKGIPTFLILGHLGRASDLLSGFKGFYDSALTVRAFLALAIAADVLVLATLVLPEYLGDACVVSGLM
jgi:hypothetical protein